MKNKFVIALLFTMIIGVSGCGTSDDKEKNSKDEISKEEADKEDNTEDDTEETNKEKQEDSKDIESEDDKDNEATIIASDGVEEGKDSEAILEEYEKVIAGYYEQLTSKNGKYLDNWLAEANYLADPASVCGYTFVDIDGNGIDELIFGMAKECDKNGCYTDEICAIYTINDSGEAERVIEGWSRSQVYYLGDSTIANIGSSGADDMLFILYSMEDARLKEAMTVTYITNKDLLVYTNILGRAEPEQTEQKGTLDDFWNYVDEASANKVRFKLTLFNE